MNAIISGKVIKGKRKSKELGFPTANIKLNENMESGVYSGYVRIGDADYKAGIFVNREGTLLEAHLIGFSGNLYGEEIEVEIGEKIRDIIKFESEEALKRQIKKDVEYICSQGL